MSLREQLDAVREREQREVPPTSRALFAEAYAYLAASGIREHSPSVGEVAPDFELPSVDGALVSLRALRRRGPVILDFFRGGWCPFCRLELRAYQDLVADIEAGGASIVAIAPELPRFLRELAQRQGLTFPLLSDPGNEVARRYGLVFTLPEALRQVYAGFGLDLPERHGNTSFELPLPGTFLLDREGRVRRSFVEVDPSQRGEPAAFVQDLRELIARG